MSKEKINKLEATGRKGMFVGYSEDSKAFGDELRAREPMAFQQADDLTHVDAVGCGA